MNSVRKDTVVVSFQGVTGLLSYHRDAHIVLKVLPMSPVYTECGGGARDRGFDHVSHPKIKFGVTHISIFIACPSFACSSAAY